jgi:cytochrome P450
VRPCLALTSCTYLRACIEESLRLSPPLPGILPREVQDGGIEVDGRFIPAGIDIGVPSYAVMRNAAYYPDPTAFKPLRWIESDSIAKESVELAQSAFCAFSIGPRGCIARGLAYTELTLVLARILWEFDVRLQPGSVLGQSLDGTYDYEDVFISKKVGPMVQFRSRS